MNMFLLFVMNGCISQEIPFKEYDISLQVVDSKEGVTHYATVLYEWFGEGDLRYPMYPIDETSFDGDTLISWLPLVEQGEGEGLVVYIWEDVNGDGVLCSLNDGEERTGLVILDESDFVVDIEIELTHQCLGFELMYSQIHNEAE